MKKYPKILLIVALSLLISNFVRAEGEESGADFSARNEYRGVNYVISYPGKGYDQQLDVLIKRLDKIVPFVEAYGLAELKNINITITESTGQLQRNETSAGEFRTEGDQIYINLPAGYYNDNVVVHEVCHLVQIPFWFPAWFGESHAETCARKYYESRGERDRVQVYNDWYGDRMEKLKNVVAEVPKYIGQEDFGPRDVVAKSALNSYLLMGELTKIVSMAEIFPKIKQDFVIDGDSAKPYLQLIPNVALICKINEVAPKDIIPLFEKYGFQVKCDEKTYDFLKSPAGSIGPGGLAAIVMLIFFGAVITAIVIFIKRRKRVKSH